MGRNRFGDGVARIFIAPGVQTERSIRFILWNNERRAQWQRAYVEQRKALQELRVGGVGSVPDPDVLGMIPHDR